MRGEYSSFECYFIKYSEFSLRFRVITRFVVNSHDAAQFALDPFLFLFGEIGQFRRRVIFIELFDVFTNLGAALLAKVFRNVLKLGAGLGNHKERPYG